ncbi:MAG: hypothetical protein GXO63_03285 [Candidatus Micrarchaeota archaeon]|nr:hypothetical protein [Candidatus Micrarchaeota archaeon]
MKAQFFIISAVVIASILFTVSQNLLDFAKIDPRRTATDTELYYINDIETTLKNVVKYSPCERLEPNIKNALEIIKSELSSRAINVSYSYTVFSCPPPNVNFRINITSFETEINMIFSV